jgi:hypothetical protein
LDVLYVVATYWSVIQARMLLVIGAPAAQAERSSKNEP